MKIRIPRPSMQQALVGTAVAVLSVVAACGAVLSYAGQYTMARHVFGRVLGAGFPLLTDALIFGSSLMYVANVRVGQRATGWRLTAHAAIAGTILLNALAAPTPADIPWHVTAPAVWSVLVELVARQALRRYRAARQIPADRIPLRLWIRNPLTSTSLWLWMGRTGERSVARARIDLAVHQAALEALKLGMGPGSATSLLAGQLRAGSLTATQIPAILDWTAAAEGEKPLQRALRTILAPTTVPAPYRRPSLAAERPLPQARIGQGGPSAVRTPNRARKPAGGSQGHTGPLGTDSPLVAQFVREIEAARAAGAKWDPQYERRTAETGFKRRTLQRYAMLARQVLAGELVLEAEQILDTADTAPVA